MKKILILLFCLSFFEMNFAQNALFIPPALTGDTFNLNIQNGVTQFYPGINTNTFGINGNILAPTLILNKLEWVTMNVTNNLTGNGNSTTMHWHGLHVPAIYDGGPHQVILQGSTWSPHFQVLNDAATYWYHPHGDNKTDRHVSKGLAGMIIIKDSAEGALTLPRTYGVDDFPIIVQSKAFDVLNQIAISTELDTAICVNATMHPYLDAPAQVIRLRLLNGSSSRSYNFGFTANKAFAMIAGDGGLLDSTVTLTRLRLSPGERAEILLDLQGMAGQTIFLKSYSSEFPNGIYGAATVTGMMGGTIPDYDLNPINGADIDILQLNVIAQTSSPVTTIPASLVLNMPTTGYTVSRNFILAPDSMMCAQCQVEGSFNINGSHFDIMSINETIYLNTIEKWRITNNTGIAHPFHIHDVQFYLLNINGGAVPNYEQGKKDVVLVMPMQYVEFITKFEDFSDDSVPYMYHCHLLHHEDEGMMGSFIVLDTTGTGVSELEDNSFQIYPNPTTGLIHISSNHPIESTSEIIITDMIGKIMMQKQFGIKEKYSALDLSLFGNGIYFFTLQSGGKQSTNKIVITK